MILFFAAEEVEFIETTFTIKSANKIICSNGDFEHIQTFKQDFSFIY